MILLLQKLNLKLHSITENHRHHHNHHHHRDNAEACLQAFYSDVSNALNQLLKPGSEIPSLPWIQNCFELLHATSKAFAKLVVNIHYPMTKWSHFSVEEYLNFTLNLLDQLNSINSLISHLGQARLTLSYALSLVANLPLVAVQHLKPIRLKSAKKLSSVEGHEVLNEEKLFSGHERVVHEALMVMNDIGLWVCGIVLYSLCGETENIDYGFVTSRLRSINGSVYDKIMEKMGVLKEIEKVNHVVGYLAAATVGGGSGGAAVAVEELRCILEVFGNGLECLGNDVECLFKEVFSGRNELLLGFQLRRE